MRRLMAAGLLAATLLGPVRPVAADSPDFSAYAGHWFGHGRSLDIDQTGAAVVGYRTYSWCDQPHSGPCDAIVGNQIVEGGQVILQLATASVSSAAGQVVQSTDPQYPVGAPVTLAYDPADAVDLSMAGTEFALFCGPDAPDSYCGA